MRARSVLLSLLTCSQATGFFMAGNGLMMRQIRTQGLTTLGSKPLYSSAAVESASETTSNPSDAAWKINLLYDGDCPLCVREVDFLRKRDIDGRILFTDVSAEDYNADDQINGGVSFEQGMRYIHAVKRDGKIVKGVEVFRQTYELIGLGYVYEATKWPIIGDIVDRVYDIWAANRLRVTGRPDLEVLLKERAEKLRMAQPPTDCEDECEIEW